MIIMAPNFDGVVEKLKRTNENILNLQGEIKVFFESSDYPVLPEDDREILLKAIEYHKNRAIPLRFSVLAGEIIHHLRSMLDHVAWQFSDEAYRRDFPRRIEFPVVEIKPTEKDQIASYERKVKGITDTRVRDLIEKLQPYNSRDPVDCPLLILHNMDIIDKHRELVLAAGTGAREIPMDMIARLLPKQHGISENYFADWAYELKGYGKLVPQVSFKEFGRRPIEAVIPGLIQLNNSVVNVIKQIAPRQKYTCFSPEN